MTHNIPQLLLSFSFLLLFCLPLASSVTLNYPAVFNFGDSNSDTGELAAGLGIQLLPPNGQTYFRQPSGRVSDGRLIIDFLMSAMKLPFLNPYLEAIGAPSFERGCNFAAAGSTLLPATPSSLSPFSFGIQVSQFLRFKSRVLQLHSNNSNTNLAKYLPAEDNFEKGLYMFDIGQNDLAAALYSNSLNQTLALIPSILIEFENGIKNLYDHGGRNFWIHNTGPLGCLAQYIATFGTDPSELDECGCVRMHNQAAKIFNLRLHSLTKKLVGQYSDAHFTYVDIFTIKYNLIANYSTYGFEQAIMVCCGTGGPPLNFEGRIFCGGTENLNGSLVTANGCNDSSKYVNWDGIHYTEAANKFVSSQILTGKFSDPPFSFKFPSLLHFNF